MQVKKVYRILLVVVFFGTMTESVFAQDPMFSQFYANPLYLSPSFAGSSPLGTRVSMNYRNQWPAIPKAFVTYSGSFDHYFHRIKSGVGMHFLRDKVGTAGYYYMNASASYSYNIHIDRDFYLRPGVSFHYTENGIDQSKFVTYQQLFDGGISVLPDVEESKADFDATVSVLGFSELFWVGLTAKNLMRPNNYLTGSNYLNSDSLNVFQTTKFAFFGGFRVKLRGHLIKYYKESLSFAYLYEHFYTYRQLSIGTYYHKNPLFFGFWYRGIPVFKGALNKNTNYPGSESVIFLVGYMVNQKFSAGYSYDFTVSGLRTASGGAHELSLVYHFKIQEGRKKITALPCPHF